MVDKERDDIIKLVSLSSEMQLIMVKGLLEDNGIHYIIKDHGPGGHIRIITGGSYFGSDIMVGKSQFEKARELLDSIGIK